MTKHRSSENLTKYDESVPGICKTTVRITHVGSPRMIQGLTTFKLSHSSRSARRAGYSRHTLLRLLRLVEDASLLFFPRKKKKVKRKTVERIRW